MRRFPLLIAPALFAAAVFAAGLCGAIIPAVAQTGAATLATAQTQTSPAVPRSIEYLIHSGDQLNVQVYGEPTLTQTVTVLEDGTINFPLVGRVAVGGKTPSQATALLRSRLLHYLREPFVTIAVTQEGQPNVMVLGDVKTPGKYVLRSGARVADAIAAAGGLSDDINGKLPDARVSDPEGNIQVISLEKLFREGDIGSDFGLTEGSVVYVPGPERYTVQVAGAVDHPGEVQVAEGDRLSMAIAKAGNSANSSADLNHISLTRTNADGTRTVTQINLYNALEKGDVSADVPLQPNDLVYVPQAHKGNGAGVVGDFLYILRALVPF